MKSFKLFNGPVRSGKPWFQIRNKAAATDVTEILIYDIIGKDIWDDSGMGAKEFADALKPIPTDEEILLRIHSPGGSVWDGLAIYHQILARRDHVTAQVDGIAFSAASFIAMAAKKVRIPKTGRMMIHDASGFAIGNADDMRKLADLLDDESDNIAGIYADKIGKSVSDVRAMMKDTLWMTGTESKQLGFADELTDAQALNCNFDLSCFRRVPEEIQNSARGEQQQQLAMNRKTLIALLNKHGIKFDQNATDEQLAALAENIPTAAATATPPGGAAASSTNPTAGAANPSAPAPTADDPKIIKINAELETIRKERDAEKKQRITSEVKQAVTDGQIPAAQLDNWVARAMRDETVLTDIRAMAPVVPGAEPLRGHVTNVGNSLMEEFKKMKPGAARTAFMVENFDPLSRIVRQNGPRNENTLSASLVPHFLSDALIVIANNKLAALRSFSRDFGTDPMRPKTTVQVPKATVGATTLTDATDFEQGDSTLTNVAVTVHQYTQAFHVINEQLNNGFKLAQLAQINADAFANKLSDIWTALLLVASFGSTTGTVIGTAANFDAGGLPAIFAVAKNFRQRNLILDGGYLAYLLPTNTFAFKLGQDGAYGFDFIGMQNRWTGATAGTSGFVASPDAIALASGLPIGQPNGEFLTMDTITIQELGLSVQSCTWYSRQHRTVWASYDIMFGAAVGDGTQGEVLITA